MKTLTLICLILGSTAFAGTTKSADIKKEYNHLVRDNDQLVRDFWAQKISAPEAAKISYANLQENIALVKALDAIKAVDAKERQDIVDLRNEMVAFDGYVRLVYQANLQPKPENLKKIVEVLEARQGHPEFRVSQAK